MKNLGKIFLCLSLCMVIFTSFTCEAAKKVVAVTAVENSCGTPNGRYSAQQLESELITILVQNKMYDVVERTQVELVLKELALYELGMLKGEKAIQFGQMTGSDYTIVGNVVAANVQRFDNYLYKGTKAKVKFNFKFIDNKTGKIMVSEMMEGSDTVSEFENKHPNEKVMLTGAVNDLSKKIFEKMEEMNPLTGVIQSINGKNIYADIGSDLGVKVGDDFIIFRDGEIIRDITTGEIITVERIIVGNLKITEVNPNYSIARLKNCNTDIKKGDKIRRGKK